MASTTSDLTDIGGAFQTTDLLYVAKDAGGGVFQDRKAAISRLDTRFQASLGFTPENVANKSTDGTLAANSDTLYASQKATKTYVDANIGANAAPYVDTQTIIKGSGDATKLLRFEVDGFTTATTRVLTPQNRDGTIADLGANIFTDVQTNATAVATPSALVATGRKAFASTVSGAALMGFGSTYDVALMNRAGSVALGVIANSTTVVANGNVGIGTATPGAKLHVKGLASETNSTIIYGEQNKNSGNTYAINGTNQGSGATLNVAGYFGATGATNNYAIQIPVSLPDVGANNYAIRSESLAKSYFAGNVGIGLTVPTAALHLKAGTATADTGPLKFTAGTLLTAPELGSVEYSDDATTGHVYATVSVAGVPTRVQLDGGGGGSSPPFVDTTAIVMGSGDATKLLRFEVDGITTGTTRVLTAQDADLTIAGINLAQAFTALQTFNLGTNVISGQAYLYNSVSILSGITALNNYFIGRAGNFTMTGQRNLAFGFESMLNNVGGFQNVSSGYQSMRENTQGDRNVAIGDLALTTNTTGDDNVGIGNSVLLNSNGRRNTAVGSSALLGVTTGADNIAMGYQAGDNMSSGTRNIIIGYDVDVPVDSGSYQIVLGNIIFAAGADGTGATIAGRVGIGVNTPLAALHIKAGEANAGRAPIKIAAGVLLTAPEIGTLEFVDDATTGHFYGTVNVAGTPTRVQLDSVGIFVLKAGDTMTGLLTLDVGANVISGQSYLYNGLPIANGITALNNYFFGGAGNFTMTGTLNAAMGPLSMVNNTTGTANMAVGYAAMRFNTTGTANMGVGVNALRGNTTGGDNTGVGNGALYTNDIGERNTAIGSSALLEVTSGSNNIGIGCVAGDNITTGSNNIVIGFNTDAPVATGSNQIAIGNIIFATGASGTGTTILGLAGIGVNTPTAALHLKAGTATASNGPLKFTAGTLLGTPELGSVEYSDNATTGHVYATVSVAGVATRVQLDSQALSGSGSPESAVTAAPGVTYADLSNTTNPGLWVKAVGVGNTGWRELIQVGP